MMLPIKEYADRLIGVLPLILGLMATGLSFDASAVPLFARQTGQNCVACHAGGQFPELTSYGRMFKLTGYTIGTRTNAPLSIMAVASATNTGTNGSSDVNADFQHNGKLQFTTASIFVGGKITDNVGLFGQWTYNNYALQNADGKSVIGHSSSDQFDLRYADRFVAPGRELIVGASLNNNPGVTDVWNTFNSAFTGMPSYVPAANSSKIPGPSLTPKMLGLGPNVAGKNVYAYWNNMLYAEIGLYQTANGSFSFLSQGIQDSQMTKLKGQNPYFRVALNHDWGAHSAMIGLHGMNAEVYSVPADTSSSTNRYKDLGIDGQYQYLLDPHTISAQFSYTREKQTYADDVWASGNPASANSFANASNTIDYFRLKGTYVYQAKYGVSLGYVSLTGSADANAYVTQNAPNGNPANASNVPNTTYWIPEVFWTPIQNLRVGMQYYAFTKFNGASSNYGYATTNDGTTMRNAKDNNTLFFYLWAAY